jgi:LCP family protein required for cell wall assembly
MFAIMGILTLTVLAGYFYVKDKIYVNSEKEKNGDNVQYTEVKGITNVLLIGTDSRSLDKLERADSIIIATLDNNNKKVKLTSLFRDSLVDIPDYGEGKINVALLQGGPQLLMKTIQQTYNIKLDKYVIINFWGFEAIIDQIGGIEIDVKDYQLEELNKYIGESTGGNDCPVTEAGLQLLNGKQALSYARIRHNVGDDYGRTERQREVLFKIAEKLKTTKPSKYLGIMNKMLEYIRTNIDPIEALNMAYTIYKFPTLNTEQLQMPVTELSESRLYKDLGSVILFDREQNAKILSSFIFEDKLPKPEEYDYDSFSAKLAAYAADEASYNSIYGIIPEEYETVYEEPEYIPKEEITEQVTEKESKSQATTSVTESSNENKTENEQKTSTTKQETPTEEQKPVEQEVNTTTSEDNTKQNSSTAEKTNSQIEDSNQ